MNRSLVFFVAVLCLFAGGMCVWFAVQAAQERAARNASGVSAPQLDPNRKLESFELTERSGSKFSSESLKGDVWVANFFFSRCPTVCWKQNQRMLEIEQEFGSQGVKFVSITVDPSNDTPSALREYATRLGAGDNWFFLTGKFEYIQKVGQDIFLVPVENGEHSEKMMLVDRSGNLRGHFSWNDDDQLADLRKELNKMLNEPPAAAAK